MDRHAAKERNRDGNGTGSRSRATDQGNSNGTGSCGNRDGEGPDTALIVREQKPIRMVGLFVMAAGVLFFVLELLYHEGSSIPLWIYVAILLIIGSGAAVYMSGKNRRLVVDREDNQMFYVNLFGRRREFSLGEIGHVRALCDASGRQDYICLYDGTGRRLCRLESHMENALLFFTFLLEHGVRVDTPDTGTNLLAELALQEKIPEESAKKLAEGACAEAGRILEEWEKRNHKTGASFDYGLAQYLGEKLSAEAQIQPMESHYDGSITERLPKDYVCALEVFVKKDGLFIRDRKKQLLMFSFPLIYKRELPAQTAAQGERTVLYYNKSFLRRLEETLRILERYLPGHRFFQEDICLSYELKRTL